MYPVVRGVGIARVNAVSSLVEVLCCVFAHPFCARIVGSQTYAKHRTQAAHCVKWNNVSTPHYNKQSPPRRTTRKHVARDQDAQKEGDEIAWMDAGSSACDLLSQALGLPPESPVHGSANLVSFDNFDLDPFPPIRAKTHVLRFR